MPRLIALDLGSHAVKATTWRIAGRNQLVLEERLHQPVPQSGEAPAIEHRLAALEALLDDAPRLKPATSDVVVVGWPASEAAFHRVVMPFSDKAQIERTLPFAVENEVPFELEDMVLGWRVARQAEASDVVAVLARKDRVAEFLTMLAERGIDPAALHVDADLYGPWGAAAQVVVEGEAPTAPPLVAVIDLGHTHTTVSVVRDAVVHLARSINVGGWSFTRAIATALSCSWEEAEQLKHGASQVELSPDEEVTDPGVRRHSGYALLPPEARQKVDEAIGLLLAEIRSTLLKAEDTLGGEVIEVRLTGGSARIDEIWDYLASDLGVPVRRAVDPRGEPSPGPFAVTQALGSATAGSGRGPVDLRLGSLAFKGRTDVLRATIGYSLAGAVVFTFAALVVFAFQYRSLAVEQAAAEQVVREIVLRNVEGVSPGSIDSLTKAEALMAGFTQDAVQRAEVLGDGGPGVPPTIDVLYHLTQALPPASEVDVELSDLTVSPTEITFNAETAGYKESAAIEDQLQKNPRFKGATKGQEQKLATGRVRFPMSIPLGDAAAAGEEG